MKSPFASFCLPAASAAVLLIATASIDLQAQAEAPVAASAPVVKPINLSRLLGGANVSALNEATGLITPVSGMTAVIDDDAASGWTPPVGKTVLVIALPAETDLNTFTLFAPGAKGDYTLSVVSSPEAARDPAARTKLLSSSLGQETTQAVPDMPARFVVLELNVIESAPIRSIDVVGRPRGNLANQFTVVVPDSSKEQNAGKADGKLAEVNFAADALGAKVINATNEAVSSLIDGDTGTTTTLKTSESGSASTSITLAAAVSVDRLSLAFEQAEGTVKFLATSAESPDGRVLGEVKLDGTTKTLTLETAGVSAESITVVWTPTDGVSPLVVSEVGAFALARVERNLPSPDSSKPAPRIRVETPPTPTPTPTPTPLPPPPPPPPVLPPSRPVST
jgi:hypothetical protein